MQFKSNHLSLFLFCINFNRKTLTAVTRPGTNMNAWIAARITCNMQPSMIEFRNQHNMT